MSKLALVKIGILAFTKKGRDIGKRLSESLPFDLYLPADNVNQRDFLVENFKVFDGFIIIGATGIAVRYVAPLLESKDVDPAIISMDELGHFVIPLVSGHLGGANEIAKIISKTIGANPVVTTATDINEKFAIDMWSQANDCKIVNVSHIKYVSASILAGKQVSIYSAFSLDGTLPDGMVTGMNDVGVAIDLSGEIKPFKKTLNLVPRIVTIGVGCRKNTDPDMFEHFILSKLAEHSVSIDAIELIGSIDLKAEEKCILDFSKKYDIPFENTDAEVLKNVPGHFKPSRFVASVTGVDNVCERSAAYFSKNGRIIMNKESQTGMTMAMAVREWKCKF